VPYFGLYGERQNDDRPDQANANASALSQDAELVQVAKEVEERPYRWSTSEMKVRDLTEAKQRDDQSR